MAIRVYTSLDTGAPVLTGTNFSRFRQILLACLVTGYGSKPGAGWVVGHQSADGLGFSVGNGDGFANFVANGTSYATAYIMETITDGTTALAGGYNRRSSEWFDGQSATSRNTQWLTALSASNPHWTIVADEKTVHVSIAGGTPTAVGIETNSIAIYFGSYVVAGVVGGFCYVGGASAPGFGPRLGRDGVCGMALRNPFTGLVDQGVTPKYTAVPALYAHGSTRTAQAVTRLEPARLMPVRAGLSCWGAGLSGSTVPTTWVIGGYLRGLISETTLSTSQLPAVLALFGLGNVWQSRISPLTLPNGQTWYPQAPHSADDTFFISTNPADWG